MNESDQNSSPANGNNNNKNNLNETQENIEKLFESIKNFFGGPYTDENDVMHDISYTK